ncbi:uncharacterized protein TRIADDRAFT_1957, partial [Trichoplax adhaerens]
EALNRLRDAKELCDVEIATDNSTIHAHRLVLASASSYFRAMFLSNLVESQQKIVHIEGISYSILSNLVNFCYTGNLVISIHNVAKTLEAADRFQLLDAKATCCLYLSRILQPYNCLGILKLAQIYDCPGIVSKASNISCRKFVHVVQSEEFLEMSFQDLVKLLSKDCLHMTSERDAYSAVSRWIKFDKTDRIAHTHDLMMLIRWKYIDEDFMQSSVYEDDLLPQSVFPLVSVDSFQSSLSYYYHNQFPRMYTEYLVIIGGMRSSKSCKCYNIHRQKWMQLPSMLMGQRRSENAAVVVVNGKVYCFGASSDSKLEGGSECFNPSKNSWKLIASLNTCHRFMFSCVNLNGIIYALGGYDTFSQAVHCAVESYNPKYNIWEYAPPMLARRYAFTAQVIDSKIYAIGGYNSTECLSSCECYDTTTEQWRYVANMPQPRARHVTANLHGLIYVISGVITFKGDFVDSVLAYDPIKDQWQCRAPLPFIPNNPQLVAFHDRLYLIPVSHNQNILQYNPRADEWRIV